jgi:tRNA-modifying protein YgfZ
MNRSPLFARHVSAGAALAEQDGFMVAISHGEAEAGPAGVRAGAAVVDLAHVQLLTLTSDDARRWANGMFTNNIKRLQPGRGNRNAMCDDRGRVQGLLDLYCVRDDHFVVVLDGVDADWFGQRYKMFLILDDIEVDELAGEATLLSVQGPAAASALEAAGLPTPEVDRAHVLDDATGVRVARRDRTGLGGFDLIVPVDRVEAIWDALAAAGARPFGLETLDALRIRAGRVAWPQDGTDKSMVHELGLNEEVCAFDKGCYVGQEVINRIDVKGLINKRLAGLVVEGDAVPPQGADVWLGDKAVGTISSATAADGAVRALAVLRKSAWDAGTPVVIRAADGERPASVVKLPFPG